MSLPNTFIVGVQKAGTTSLYDWMAQHPDILGPEVMKDFHFFTKDEHYSKGVNWLGRYYDDYKGEKIVMEGGVNYIFSEVAPKRFYDYNPDQKFILVLRDPVKRAFSAFNYFAKMGVEERTFQEAIADEKKGIYQEWNEKIYFSYLEHGLYHKQLQNYLKYFQLSQFKILFFEDLLTDKEGIVREVYQFLKIDETYIPEFSTKNTTGKARFRSMNKFMNTHNPVKETIKKILPIHKLLSDKHKLLISNYVLATNTTKSEKNTIPKEISDFGKTYFAKDIAMLEKLVDFDFKTKWTYST